MKLAVFYDFLETMGGGERVALLLASHFGADLITTQYDPELPTRAGYPGIRVVSLGRVVRTPPLKQIHASWKFRRSRLDGYDFHLILGNWALYAARRHHPNAYYCLTPTRSFFDQREAMLSRLAPGIRGVARAWTALHGRLERNAIRDVDRIAGISGTVQARIRQYYARASEVIYPPVATSKYRFTELGEAWLSVSRLYPEKRIDLLFEVFRRLPSERLILVGGHAPGDRARRYLERLDPPQNVTILGPVPEDRLLDLYARCHGFITAAVDEDFGLTPVEAMASGKCVLATDEGGYRETIQPGRTGYLLPPNPDSFVEKIRELDESRLLLMREDCIRRAQAFDESVFLKKMKSVIERSSSPDL